MTTLTAQQSANDKPATPRLAAGPSLLLDAVRFCAAIAVVVGHVSQPVFGHGLPSMANFATAAVAVFFVLSGFVIRYISLARYSDLRRYTIDRAARIYSVALPALVLTIVLDTASRKINPGFYLVHWRNAANHPVSGLFLNITFLAQSWFGDVSPLSNSPFWSLSYECMYYALYGAAFYLSGSKRLLVLAIILAMAGLPILLLFPAWLLGSLTFDIYAAGRFTLRSTAHFASLSALILATDTLRRLGFAHPDLALRYLGRVWIVQGYVAIPAALSILLGTWSLRSLVIPEERRLIRILRWFANATFVLYLIHFPVLVLIAAVVPYNHASAVAQFAIVVCIVLIAAPIAALTDRLKGAMRKGFASIWPASSSQHPRIL